MPFYFIINDILGHKFNAQGLHLLPEKDKGMKDAPKPGNVFEFESWGFWVIKHSFYQTGLSF